MERKIILTGDGSHSISVPELNVAYHSIHGAIEESIHVYINAGFYHRVKQLDDYQVRILEVGSGTGLNVLLTAIAAVNTGKSIYYVALEPDPLSDEEILALNYCERLDRQDLQEIFLKMHKCEWNKNLPVTTELLIHKSNATLQRFEHKTKFDLIYFDAFAPNAQPEMWTKEIFEKIHALLDPGGILVTYCSKGDVRRAMIAAGLEVEKLPGPPKKREMLRAAHPKVI